MSAARRAEEAGLRLLFLTQTYPRSEEDTAGPFIRDLARGLARAGDRVTVLAPHASGLRDGWEDGGVEVQTFRYAPESWEVLGYGRSLQADETVRMRAGLVTPLYLRSLRRSVASLLESRSWDLVHAHWVVPNAVAVSSLAALRRQSPPLAVGLHGSDVFLAEKPGVRTWVARTLGRTRLLTGCSPELVDRVRRLGFAGDLHRVIPYGVDPLQFRPDRERGRDFRRSVGIPEDAILAVGVGRMATKKGFHVLVQGLPELFERCPDLHLLLAGGGDRLEELRRRSEPWRERVHLPGTVERDVLPDLYRAADLFVLPAVHDRKGNVDGLPNVILEAMATGLPIVASAISGIPIAVESGRHGWLVPEGDKEALVDALVRLVEDPERRREMGRASRVRVERELDWDAVAGRYRAAYLDALEAPHRSTGVPVSATS